MRSNGNGSGHNRRHWDAMFATDPKHAKKFKRPGGFGGTAIDPIHRFEKMTETFGPYTEGWGSTEPQYQLVTDPSGTKPDTMVYCTVGVWIGQPDRIGGYGVGGDKCIKTIPADKSKGRPERVEFDDEAFKKAHTDALTNALVRLGNSADVHFGLFDDHRYVDEIRKEFSKEHAPKPPLPAVPVEITTCHGEVATYELPDEANSVRAAIESDLSEAANMGPDAVKDAWERHRPAVAQLEADVQAAVKAKAQGLLGVKRRAAKEAVAQHEGEPDPTPTVGEMEPIPDHLRREPSREWGTRP